MTAKNHKIGNLITNIFLCLSVIIFIGTIIFSSLGGSKPDAFILGHKPFIITSGSMAPELPVNSIVLIKQTSFDSVKVGDIISFKSDNYDLPICHRIAKITDQGFITKGDNVDIPDQEIVTSEKLLGKLIFKTSFFASYITFVQQRGVLLGVILPVIIIIDVIISVRYLLSRGHPKDPKDPQPKTSSKDAPTNPKQEEK